MVGPGATLKVDERGDAMTAHPSELVELTGFDHLNLFVGNARSAAAFFSSSLGFDVVAYRGPETAAVDCASYLLEQGAVRIVVTGAVRASSEVAEHVHRHGDGVREIVFGVDDVPHVFSSVVDRGARPVEPPTTTSDDDGYVTRGSIAVYGETLHVFLDRHDYRGVFLPGYVPTALAAPGPRVGLEDIDHVVANVEEGMLEHWVRFYEEVFGFSELTHFGADEIHTKYSALASTVVWNHGNVVLPINEPAVGLRKSQITEYLEHYGGPGIQHLALRTPDIVGTVGALRDRGVRFLAVPDDYYDDARDRMAGIELPWTELRSLGILVDRDELGHLLQIFTEDLGDRPTLFVEIIQRAGATGFGEGNFRALFEAIEGYHGMRVFL
jgi:4-hydroxyphenylpyruvate dioxygenase